jgi:hypothetical protein
MCCVGWTWSLQGSGEFCSTARLENRREILWYGRETIADLPESIEIHTGNRFISRTYRILVGNRPIMLINEKFPIDSPVWQEGDEPVFPARQAAARERRFGLKGCCFVTKRGWVYSGR